MTKFYAFVRITLKNWRNRLALFGLLLLLVGGYMSAVVAKSYHSRLLLFKATERMGFDSPTFSDRLKPDRLQPYGLVLPDLADPNWSGPGASRKQELGLIVYGPRGRALPHCWLRSQMEVIKPLENGRIVPVKNTQELLTAIRGALMGDIITLQPGVYSIKAYNIPIATAGSPQRPIRVRAKILGDAVLELDTLEGFWVIAPFWVFENLDIKGVRKNHDYGEHAFHVVGKAKSFVLRNCRVHEFNAMIKGNGVKIGDVIEYPDGVLIEGNSFFNSQARQTSNPVTFIDVVGANQWTIRGNLIADFAKGQGDRISYGAFLKGNSADGVFENNLVIGEYRHTGGTRVGLSLGGGGTGDALFRTGNTSVEHTGGVIRNNIVMYCSDVGLYLNKARATQVLNNTFFRTMGIDVRFPASTAVIKNNLVSGWIRDRDGGVITRSHNIVTGSDYFPTALNNQFVKWFKEPYCADFSIKYSKKILNKGATTEDVFEDFFGNPRGELGDLPDIGAIEYTDKNNKDTDVGLLTSER